MATEDSQKPAEALHLDTVKAAVIQALSVLDGEGGGTKVYSHTLSQQWIGNICKLVLERLTAQRKAYKYIVQCIITRRAGGGVHVCSSAYYSQGDGSYNHSLESTPAYLHAVVSVSWCAI
eukprot:Tbor_TRINITY_DN5813_c4_g1::TRINITY_DN5813_c4_g1_i3::g.6296::m.6296/K10420/DYNLT; dynein light chain Tctex-type 1